MTIRTKILIPIILILLILLTAFTYALLYLNGLRTDMNEQVRTLQTINDLSARISIKRQDARQDTLVYLIAKDPKYLELLDQNTQTISKLLTQLKPLITTSEGKALLDRFEKNRTEVMVTREALVHAVQKGNSREVETAFKIWEIKANNAYVSLLDFMNYNNNTFDQVFETYGSLINRILLSGILLMGLTVIAVVSFYGYLRRVVTIPLRHLTQVAKQIATVTYKPRYQIQSNDELGDLSRALRAMSFHLNRYHKNLKDQVKRKELELKRVKEFEAQKDTFLSIASHELKTPITSLKLYEHLLRKELTKKGKPEFDMYLTRIESQIDKITDLISTFLNVSLVRAGKMPLNMKKFDLNSKVLETVELFRKIEKDRMITVKGTIQQLVWGDEDKISQVIENLISNAVKYSPKGGLVAVAMQQNESQVIVSVTDSGIGIDKAYHRKIFSRFFRVAGTDETTYPGLGIGLYISAEIIKKHAGKLWVDSEKGKGSTFSFMLPLT